MAKEVKIGAFRTKLFVFSLTIIVFSFLLFTPQKKDLKVLESQVTSNNSKVTVVWVREDSLINLLHRFLKNRNILPLSQINPSGNSFDIKIARFGNNIEFYNNKALCLVKDQGFTILENTNGEIDAHFKRKQISENYYVELPTDVFFRVLE